MNDEPRRDFDLVELAQEHYRPEPLTSRERTRIFTRVQERAEALPASTARRLRFPGLAWGCAAAAAIVAAFSLVLDFSGARVDPGGSTVSIHASIDSALIPTEAYAVDLDSDFLEDLPADYLAIETLLVDR
jgi:hypothetical protein